MILLVDDKPENLFSLKAILSLHSFPVDTALSGEEALKKVLSNSYALIILDVQMPGMDGFEVAETISGYSKSKDIPIIFLSAVNTDKKFITRGYSSGAIDYITKPIDPDILLLKVKTFYRLYEQNRKLNEMHDNLVSEVAFRKKAEQYANEKAFELKSILESIPQIAFTTRSDGELEYTNSQWLDYAGTESDFPETHPDDPGITTQTKKAIAAGTPLELEIRLKRAGREEYRYHLLRILPVKKDNNIVKWVGTFTDIEEQKQAEKRKDEFMSIASHELRTPLTSIKMYMQLLESITEKQTDLKLYTERTLFQIKKLERLIADLLDVSKIQHGKLSFVKKEFDFGSMLGLLVEIARKIYPDYEISYNEIADVLIYGDEIRLEQVILNFISNAVKYSADNKKIIIETSVKDQRLHIAVRDFGIGIPKERQQKLFTKFYRVEGTSPGIQGLGIGLYICAEILNRHEGVFGVESEPGKGSNFYFSIPLKESL